MRGVSLSDLHCSIARTLDVVGERWTLLILRDAFNGVRRFEDFEASLPIASNVLTARLHTLIAHRVLERQQYRVRPPRYEYRLTDRGRRLYPVLIALLQWGDEFLAGEAGPPIELMHRDCGHPIAAEVVCPACRETLQPWNVRGTRAAGVRAAVEPASPA
jgi:DNA-binding HxlR family transcriptional regulator